MTADPQAIADEAIDAKSSDRPHPGTAGSSPTWSRLKKNNYVRASILLAPATIYVVVVFLYPVLALLATSVRGAEGELSAVNYQSAFLDDLYRSVMWNTLYISVTVTVACLLIGYAMAYAMVTVLSRWANLLLALIVLSFWTSALVRTYAWMIILGSNGLVANAMRWLGIESPPQMLYNLFGSVVGIVNVMLPYMILALYVVMKQVDPNLMKAAASLGASPWRAFRRVYLPNTLSGIAAGSILVFMVTIGFFITPALLGSAEDRMISQIIALLVQTLLNWELAAAVSAVLIIATLILLAIYSRLVGADKIGAMS